MVPKQKLFCEPNLDNWIIPFSSDSILDIDDL